MQVHCPEELSLDPLAGVLADVSSARARVLMGIAAKTVPHRTDRRILVFIPLHDQRKHDVVTTFSLLTPKWRDQARLRPPVGPVSPGPFLNQGDLWA